MNDDLTIARRYISKQMNAERKGYEFELTFKQYKKLSLATHCNYTGMIIMKKYLASKFVSFNIQTITDIKEISKNGILQNNGVFTPCDSDYDKLFDTFDEAKQWLTTV